MPACRPIPPDACIPCNAVINPCPVLGLYCYGAIGCCDTSPH